MHPFSTPWCFQGVDKGCIGNKWLNKVTLTVLIIMIFNDIIRFTVIFQIGPLDFKMV